MSPHLAMLGASEQSGLPLSYPVHIGRGIAVALGDVVRRHAPAHRVVIIADATVARFHGDLLRSSFGGTHVDLLTVPPGESEKTRERWAQLTDALIELECGRDTTIVAAGGGVVCDLAGFVAATFMRGVPVVQVPTTLLAMVDASVGGKTAVDTPLGKNLVGAFHDPSAVLMDVDLLRTLPVDQLRGGLSEILKHGIIADASYLQHVLLAMPELTERGAEAAALPEIIADSIRIKADVVAHDRREAGLRHVLNFGHTIAHAIEQASNYRVSHGDAVAVGMVVESRIAELSGIANEGLTERVAAAVASAGLPTSLTQLTIGNIASVFDPSRLVGFTRSDKKSRGGFVRYALPWQLGEMHAADGAWSVAVADGLVVRALG